MLLPNIFDILNKESKDHKGVNNMKKKGFTLIETLAVLVLLSVIAVIATPMVLSTIHHSKNGLYQRQIEKIIEAGKSWGSKNAIQLPKQENERIYVSLKDLALTGFIDAEEVLDPRNNKEMNGCLVIALQNKKHTYTYVEESCENAKGEYLIFFDDRLNKKEEVEVNSVYQAQQVTAVDLKGNPVEVLGPIIKNVTTNKKVNTVDTSNVGTKYELTYTARDTNGNKKNFIIQVTVVDTIAPTITVQGKTNNFTYYYSLRDNKFTIPTATVVDNSGKVKQYNGKDYKVTSTVSNLPGTYRIVYEAEDEAGNKRKLTVTVVIENNTKPVIKNVTGNPTSWQNKDVTLTIRSVSSKSKIVGYSFDNGTNWQTSSKKVFPKNQTVTMKVKDQDGNISEPYQVGITKIDKTPPTKPVITLHKSNSGGTVVSSGTWVNTSVSQVQTSKDTESGIAKYERSIDRKTWTSMSTNALESKEQEQHYYVRAKDRAGNVSAISDMYILRIDKTAPTAPTVTLYKDPNRNSTTGSGLKTIANNTWDGKYVLSVATKGNDVPGKENNKVMSGFAGYTWSVDGTSGTTSYKRIEKEGTHTITWKVKDKAGNVSTGVTRIIKLDHSAPTIRVRTYKESSGGKTGSVLVDKTNANTEIKTWKNYGYYFDIDVTESLSGLKSQKWEWNQTGKNTLNTTLNGSGSPSTSGGDKTLTGNGIRYGKITMTDNVGNTRSVTVQVWIDTVKPTITWSISGETVSSGVYKKGAVVTAKCKVGLSGLSSITIKDDTGDTGSSAGTNARKVTLGSAGNPRKITSTCKSKASATVSSTKSYKIKVYGKHSSCGAATCVHKQCGCATSTCTKYKQSYSKCGCETWTKTGTTNEYKSPSCQATDLGSTYGPWNYTTYDGVGYRNRTHEYYKYGCTLPTVGGGGYQNTGYQYIKDRDNYKCTTAKRCSSAGCETSKCTKYKSCASATYCGYKSCWHY